MKRYGVYFIFFLVMLMAGTGLIGQDAKASGDLEVRQMTLCKNVENKEPVDVVENFSLTDGQAYCHAVIANKGSGQTLAFRWSHNDKEYFRLEVQAGTSANWRTKSAVKLQPGAWKVELLNGDQVLKELAFQVTEN